MTPQQIGNALGAGISTFGNYASNAAATANGVSRAAQTAQGQFNQGSADIANDITQQRLMQQYQFNSAQAASANQFSLDMWERMAEFNHKEAELNRQWQERMSNTSYQRAVKDLQAAGLNPALAINGLSGATTPSGGQATVSSAQGAMASGSAPSAISASEGNYSGQMEYLGGMLGLLSAGIAGIGSAAQAFGGLGKFGEGIIEKVFDMFENQDKNDYNSVKGNAKKHHNDQNMGVPGTYEYNYKNRWKEYWNRNGIS